MAIPVREALITSKLGVPARGAPPVERARLLALLRTTPEVRLILVSAPAGFGKSTLLAAWLGDQDVRSAWLALDPSDNDVVRFARYLEAAVASLAGPGDDAGADRDPGQPFDPETVLAGIVSHLAAAVADGRDPRAVLVLDDYHAVGEPAIHRLVGTLVERLPPGAQLVVATRSDPPLPLARLRARGELLEVRAQDLRFTSSEAGELLRSTAIELAQADVEELTERTEGWAAALRLAAVSLRGRPDQAALVRRFGATHRFVFDYVVEEVLAGLPPAAQDFLLRTSILDRLSGALCDAITGRADGQERLEELERANLLIVPLDDERRWYRYHALFAEVLRARLRASDPGADVELHARAGRWHAARGDDEAAIAHAVRSDDLAWAVRLVGEASLRRLNAGELSTVRRWLQALPDSAVRGDAQLSASYAWCLVLPGETAGVVARLADAERAIEDDGAGDPVTAAAIRTQLALIRSRLADLEGDVAEAIAQARLARDLLPAGLPLEGETTLRGDATILLARGLLAAGDMAGAAEAYEASLPDLRAGGNLFAVGRAVADLAAIAIARGDHAQAARICEAELERTPPGSAARASGAVWVALARASVELGRIELAEAAATRAIELATRAGDTQVVRSGRSILKRIEALQERPPAHRPAGSRWAAPGLAEPLTARELEVLRLVALGRSNSQVAAELFVTVGTVKSHLHTISGKLGAANRVEAVARGRELGLLG